MHMKAGTDRTPTVDSARHQPASSITPGQVLLVKNSWTKVAPMAEHAAALFYDRLFQLDPSLKSLFTGDMRKQGTKLTQMISVAVNSLDRFDTIVPALEDLGRRHVGYGVKEQHYDTVGAALLWTLAQGLGDEFTADTKEAWTVVYEVLATAMKRAAVRKAH